MFNHLLKSARTMITVGIMALAIVGSSTAAQASTAYKVWFFDTNWHLLGRRHHQWLDQASAAGMGVWPAVLYTELLPVGELHRQHDQLRQLQQGCQGLDSEAGVPGAFQHRVRRQ